MPSHVLFSLSLRRYIYRGKSPRTSSLCAELSVVVLLNYSFNTYKSVTDSGPKWSALDNGEVEVSSSNFAKHWPFFRDRLFSEEYPHGSRHLTVSILKITGTA